MTKYWDCEDCEEKQKEINRLRGIVRECEKTIREHEVAIRRYEEIIRNQERDIEGLRRDIIENKKINRK